MSGTPTFRNNTFHSVIPQASRIRIQPPGQRILRSVISVWLCMVVYVLRGMRGEPFYSIIAALQCVQPYSSNMLREGKDRIIGTLAGAFWGSAILFLELLPVGGDFRTTVVFYILLGIFTGLVIYSTVLLNISQYALFAAVVFLGIAVYHIEDANPFIHVFYRTLETGSGTAKHFLCRASTMSSSERTGNSAASQRLNSTVFSMTACASQSRPSRLPLPFVRSCPGSTCVSPLLQWTAPFSMTSIR